MKIGSHYTDSRGQHQVPECMANSDVTLGSVLCPEYDGLDGPEADEIHAACRALGIVADTDSDGALEVVRFAEE